MGQNFTGADVDFLTFSDEYSKMANVDEFQVLHDEELGEGDQRGLKVLYNAVQNQPNINNFLNSPEDKR
ncbi:uncharacterized protein Z518_05338 [Rhinocladiella mackenziei CBS 650.93]|uniref:Uncharacterized protein n=1 Tax=Rhinocladiella mackenziei CBS 650.93 TaxID=1442369 RepID=A0A0D2J5Z7_9EURO|nr:uncharacterized protein Z518_05338 [Rhinocladiella mackenziei CBS 650.93]KIX04470.1 hypothetical protein Z518_05338 [Rhinocladiella mackenziei CBS 650.93]